MEAGGRGRARQFPLWFSQPARYRGRARQLPSIDPLGRRWRPANRTSFASVVPIVSCPSAAGPTSIAIVKGGSRPSAEPGIPPGDASGLPFIPVRRAESAVARCAVARILDVVVDIDPLQGPRLSEGLCRRGGAFSPAEPFVLSGDACGPTFPSVNWPGVGRLMPRRNQTLMGWSPNALSPSVSATSPLTSSGPTPRRHRSPARISSGREAERGVRCRGVIPASQTVRYA